MRWRSSGGGGPQNETALSEPISPAPHTGTVDEDDDEQDYNLAGGPQHPSRTSRQREELSTSSSEEMETDDPGMDHAEPLNWKPQTQQSTCEFTHVITNYSQKRESGCKKAEYSGTTVDDFGNRWRLIVYVNGNGRASNHHLSLFLQVADAEDLPFGWKKAVSYVLTLEHPSGVNLGYAKRNPDKTFKLCPKAIDWGWSQFITSDRIQQEGYVSNDSLTVRASVTVKSSSISIDAEDAELYLKCAVEEGNPDAVRACLEQGAGINCQFKDDLYTPLHTACSSTATTGSLQVLELLLEKGADGNACNKWRETPLLIAANNGHLSAVDALLKHGADPSLCSEAGWSALTFAAHKGYDDIVLLLLEAGAAVNCRVTEDLSTPLHKACAGGKPGHLSAVKQLLENGANVHALNKWRETPLLTAANHGQAATVEALLRAGADPCKCTDTGWSPLSIAAYKGHDDVVRLLLEEGAPTEEADPTLSALLQAATKGLPDTVELLLRHGADHTVTTKKGDTALSILVEQNLIDAAVEMVTEYKASVPRCSRDRKKVQRARLLINLRVKQQQREGVLSLCDDEDDAETDEETDESNLALHDQGLVAPAVQQKKHKKTMESAEAQARAAEEALLLELEQEESKAQKDEAVANSKRAKKKKRKERERQQREQKEREQRERLEREAEERERLRREREEKDRQAREKREKERRDREMREAEKRVREAAARRREKEEKEKKQQEQRRKEKERMEKSGSDTDSSHKGNTKTRGNNTKKNGFHPHEPKQTPPKPARTGGKQLPMHKRGWESKAVNPPKLVTAKSTPVVSQSHRNVAGGPDLVKAVSSARPAPGTGPNIFSPEDQLESMAAGVVDFLGFDSQTNRHVDNVQSTQISSNEGKAPLLHEMSPKPSVKIDLPEVVLFRQEKLGQLFQRCALARSQVPTDAIGYVSEDVIKAVIYRWIIRAAHDSSPFLDPLIPSWTDFNFLSTFLQRQFIAEGRKGVNSTSNSGTFVSMEALKEAGASFATLCHSLAKDVVQYCHRMEEQVRADWSDSTHSMTGREVMRNGLGSVVCIDWANRAQVYLSTSTFAQVTERHTGSSGRLLAALFAAKKRYDITRMLVSGSSMDYRLSPLTKQSLKRDAGITSEIWTDPFSVVGSSPFFGCYFDIDTLFGGLAPFGRESVAFELSKLKRGASVAGMLPLDNMLASLYIRRMVDLMEAGDKEGIPLSFIVILHSGCFRDLSRPPNPNDAIVLEPRLGERHGVYVRCAEMLPAGQHTFNAGEGVGLTEICRTGSLFLLLQNEAGNKRLSMSEAVLLDVIHSMSVNVAIPQENTFTSSYSESFLPSDKGPVSFSPRRHETLQSATSDFVATERLTSSSLFANGTADSRRPRRGRLFDLIDDDEDDTGNDVDVVYLDPVLFQNAPKDIDIEAISLGMGIGGTRSGPLAPEPLRSVSGPVGGSLSPQGKSAASSLAPGNSYPV